MRNSCNYCNRRISRGKSTKFYVFHEISSINSDQLGSARIAARISSTESGATSRPREARHGSGAVLRGRSAVERWRRLSRTDAKAPPRRAVDGQAARATHRSPSEPIEAWRRAVGRGGRTGRATHSRAWLSTHPTVRCGQARRRRRRDQSTATQRNLRCAACAKTCAIW